MNEALQFNTLKEGWESFVKATGVDTQPPPGEAISATEGSFYAGVAVVLQMIAGEPIKDSVLMSPADIQDTLEDGAQRIEQIINELHAFGRRAEPARPH